jgi:hypothetical protein
MSLTHKNNIVISSREECAQLFYIFTGLYQTVPGLSAMEFLQKTGLANRNFVIFRDPTGSGFKRGVSDEIPDFRSLLKWQHEHRKRLNHVRETYCIGVSAGGIPAIRSGHSLGAATVWCFGARPPSQMVTDRYVARPGRRNSARRIRSRLRGVGRQFARWGARAPARSPLKKERIDIELIDQTVVELKSYNGATEYRLYYVPSNANDSYVHDRLIDCPGMASYPVQPSPRYQGVYRKHWDHLVLSVIKDNGDLADLFPVFDPA